MELIPKRTEAETAGARRKLVLCTAHVSGVRGNSSQVVVQCSSQTQREIVVGEIHQAEQEH